MREIKFRAWDENNKVMHNDFQFIKSGNEGNDWILFTSDKQPLKDGYDKWTTNPYFQQQFKIMQYIGLKDDNGKEIYDGDIIDYGSSYLLITVEWNDDTCKFQFSDGSDINDNETYGRTRFVVGNIYENPEPIN